MKKIFERIEFECEIDCEVKYSKKETASGEEIYTFIIDWDCEKVDKNTQICLSLKENAVGHFYYWNPCCGMKRNVPFCPSPDVKSMTSISAPVACFYDGKGRNAFTCALSEVKEVVGINTSIVNNDCLGMKVRINLSQYTKKDHLELKLLINEVDMPMYIALDNVRKWWEEECELKPMAVPEIAKDSMYSSWYSFLQELYQEDVLSEVKKAADMGLNAVILDDGWQTAGYNNRYAHTGDWLVSKEKFSDFAGTVEKMHDWGMKVLLWIGVPYVGIETELWKKFEDKILQYSDWARAGVLDPRYPQVREHLIETLKRLMVDYNLDGFKLDFIDLFYETEYSKISDEMDYLSVQDAVDRLMIDIKCVLSEIRPELLIEFRQKYIGPNMRKYGNMFRVNDCPDDYLANRVGVLDLRLLSGNTAVHSDMLIWNENEPVENAALQIINIIFGTMQFSCRFDKMSDEHKRMVKFWIDFMAENKELLLNSSIMVEEPQLLYTLAKTEKNNESVVAVYANGKCVSLNSDIKKTIVLNGTQEEKVILDIKTDGTYRIKIQNCCGDVIRNENLVLNRGVCSFDVPQSGLITISE